MNLGERKEGGEQEDGDCDEMMMMIMQTLFFRQRVLSGFNLHSLTIITIIMILLLLLYIQS